MKKMILLVAGSLMALTGCNEKMGGKVSLNSDKAKYSYAVGMQIGRNMKSQNIELDQSAFSGGISDMLAGKDAKMSDAQVQEALKKMADMRNEKRKKAADDNKSKGEEFLKANKAKEGIKMTESGLQYKVLTEGNGAKPALNDTVKVHYKGTLTDGKEFDSSYKRNKPAEFPVRAVIPGWTEALQLMSVGSKYQLFIPSKLAYGERGNPSIPGNSVLLFDVELLEIKAKDKK